MSNRWDKLSADSVQSIVPEYGPLSGIRVLLNGSVVAAPFAATMLSDFGAEVIALERPGKGDVARAQMPQIEYNGKHISGAWAQNARNKLSFTLETNFKKSPKAKEIFLSLIKISDVWIENIVWLEKLGLSDDMLIEVNPRLIICHVSGFGTRRFGGMDAELSRAGYDPIAQAESGWNYLQGFPDKPPYYAQQYIGDYLTGLFAANGILMALINREKTGKGQIIESSLAESYMRVMDDNFTLWSTMKIQKERQGIAQTNYQPARLFQTKDNRWINLGAYGKPSYEKCLKAMGFDLEKYSYEAAGGSKEAVASPLGRELDELFDKFFRERTAKEALSFLLENNIAASLVRNCDEVMGCPHWQLRGDWVIYEDQTLGRELTAYGFHPKMSTTPGHVWRGAPALGQDTEKIMKNLLGYSEKEIAAIKGKGIID
ncbi:MAG: CoA transferase [Eubacterium sp.]|nr:CoA transferase [Eubacterium sp.]